MFSKNSIFLKKMCILYILRLTYERFTNIFQCLTVNEEFLRDNESIVFCKIVNIFL